MERNELTLEQEMRRVWDVEQVKQLMHKRVFLQTWDRRQEELDTLWVTEPERKKTASYGSNWGYYVGMEAIRGYYVDAHQAHLEEQRAANGAGGAEPRKYVCPSPDHRAGRGGAGRADR